MSTNNMNAKIQDTEIVIAELERSLAVLEANYRKVVWNLDELRKTMDKDDLTQLLRRGAFMKRFDALLHSSQQEGKEAWVLMIDVDHFKRVNDTYGHQTGDAVLERVSALVRSYLRPLDLAGRYGGEEIIVGLQASATDAQALAENIRKALEQSRMSSSPSGSGESVEFQVTLSIGLAKASEHGYSSFAMISAADEALYTAKHQGRNRVVNASERAVAPVIELSMVRAAAAEKKAA